MRPHRNILLIILLNILEYTLGKIPHDFAKVKVCFTDEDVQNIINNPSVTVMYYYKRELSRLRHFFKEYDKSAEYLAIYGVQTGIIDCTDTDNKLPSKCSENLAERSVFSYRNGDELLILNLETMFDVNSIMSNILQLVLLHEVPIIQTEKDKDELIQTNKGKYDVVFSYQRGIGTYEHRIFMEVAYAYQDKYKFAVTTERDVIKNLREADSVSVTSLSALWILHCKDVQDEDECIDIRYRNKLDLPSLAKFLRALSFPQYVIAKPDFSGIPYYKENMDLVILVHDQSSKDKVIEIVDTYKYDLHGIVGIVIIDMDIISESVRKSLGIIQVPSIGVTHGSQDNAVFMTTEWSTSSVSDFLVESLFNKKAEFLHNEGSALSDTEVIESVDNPNDHNARYHIASVEEVEGQDDKVAEAAFMLSSKPPVLDHIEALTDKTFTPSINSSNTTMLLFYLPFDAVSSLLLRVYMEVSLTVENESFNLKRINCYDWTDVCSKQNISKYPSLRIYKKGQIVEDYNSVLDKESIIKYLRMSKVNCPMPLKTEEEVAEFIQGKRPQHLSTMTNISALGIFDKNHQQELKAFQTVADEYNKMVIFGITDSSIAKQMVKVKAPAVILIRHDDVYKKEDGLNTEINEDSIRTFIEDKKRYILAELTPKVFPSLYQSRKPLLILFLDETVSLYTKETIAALSKSGKFPHLTFCWIDIHANNGIGSKILKAYTQSNDVQVPSVSVLIKQEGKVFNFKGTELSENELNNWLNDIFSTTDKEPSKMLTAEEWKPAGKGYNFLAMMDYEARGHGTLDPEKQDEIGYDQFQEERSISDIEVEEEARAELIGLTHSRLYHSHKERKSEDMNINIKRDEL